MFTEIDDDVVQIELEGYNPGMKWIGGIWKAT